ncbi:unnamed protein product [Closterium sp. NIES-53]
MGGTPLPPLLPGALSTLPTCTLHPPQRLLFLPLRQRVCCQVLWHLGGMAGQQRGGAVGGHWEPWTARLLLLLAPSCGEWARECQRHAMPLLLHHPHVLFSVARACHCSPCLVFRCSMSPLPCDPFSTCRSHPSATASGSSAPHHYRAATNLPHALPALPHHTAAAAVAGGAGATHSERWQGGEDQGDSSAEGLAGIDREVESGAEPMGISPVQAGQLGHWSAAAAAAAAAAVAGQQGGGGWGAGRAGGAAAGVGAGGGAPETGVGGGVGRGVTSGMGVVGAVGVSVGMGRGYGGGRGNAREGGRQGRGMGGGMGLAEVAWLG